VAIPRDFPHGYGLVDVTDTGYAFSFVQLADRELLEESYKKANPILRRYARGRDEELAFAWTKP
jgi:hypothetical protein